MNKLGDLSCNEFLTELASAAPAPGGGGGAGMGGGFAGRLPQHLLPWLLI